jgi:hypothetical protein
MAKEMRIVGYVFESLVGRFIMMGENWTKQDIIDIVYMLYQSLNRSWNNSCEFGSHKS